MTRPTRDEADNTDCGRQPLLDSEEEGGRVSVGGSYEALSREVNV